MVVIPGIFLVIKQEQGNVLTENILYEL